MIPQLARYLVAILEFVATLLAVVSLPGDGPLDDPDADVELAAWTIRTRVVQTGAFILGNKWAEYRST